MGKTKILAPRPRKNFDFNAKGSVDAKVTQLGIHLETLFERGVNFKDRIITIKTEIDSDEFGRIDAALSEMESEGRKTITVRINSPGGSVYDALAIVGRLRASKCKIVTEGYGHVMSAATLILACGDERKISKYAWYMTHEASYEIEGSKSLKDHKNMVIQTEKEEKKWAEWMAEFTNRDAEFWRKIQADKDAYLSPNELLEMGVIDEVMGLKVESK
jgi:ATP-dependent Clp protease protease subunit